MKLHRAAIVAGAALIAAACSGDEPAAAPQTTVAVVESAESPATTAIPATTAAPTTAAPVVENDAPESLAFASTRDIGRLFEIDGTPQLFDSPGGDIIAILEDGRIVQAGAARNVDGSLLVGVIDPTNPTVALGWVDSTDLRPTTQALTSTDPSLANQLGMTFRTSGQDAIEVVTRPGGSSVAATLLSRQSVLYSGNSALAPDGQTWFEVLSTDTGTILGWLPSRNFTEVRGTSAQDGAFGDTARQPARDITYGSSLPIVEVSTLACNAVQIELVNESTTRGMAFVFASEVPFAVVGAGSEVWNGTRLFVDPGDSTTLTLPNLSAETWFFASLDGDLRAEAVRTIGGDLSGAPGSRALATNLQEVSIPAGTCAFDPATVVPDDFNIDYDIAPGELESLEEEPEDDAELADEEGEEGDGDDALVDGEVDETTTTTTTTTTTAAPTTTTTAAPTTTTTAAPTTTTAAPTTTAPTTTTTTVAPTDGAAAG